MENENPLSTWRTTLDIIEGKGRPKVGINNALNRDDFVNSPVLSKDEVKYGVTTKNIDDNHKDTHTHTHTLTHTERHTLTHWHKLSGKMQATFSIDERQIMSNSIELNFH